MQSMFWQACAGIMCSITQHIGLCARPTASAVESCGKQYHYVESRCRKAQVRWSTIALIATDTV